MIIRFLLLTAFTCLASASYTFGQGINGQNVITTAVPFLTIAPDSRSAAMGDAGVATSPDANSIFWNPAKLAFSDKKFGASVSYTPWLRNLINDMSLSYLSGYYKWDDKQAVGLSLTYFDLGSIQFTDIYGGLLNNSNPTEFAITTSYSRKLGRNFSMAVNLKFINSNLTDGFSVGGGSSKAGQTGGADIGAFYTKDLNWKGKDIKWTLGGMISNLAGKVAYNNSNKDFVPTNLRIGTAFTNTINPYNKLTWALDFNKLMVPTPDPVTVNNVTTNRSADKGFISGVTGSFTDAPGGFKEEIQEISISTGFEYWYRDAFALRAGYFGEHKNKGDRKFLSLGLGLRSNKLGLDFSYLFPLTQNSPLANTLRLSVLFNVGNSDKKATQEEITN
ncbi:MAG: type IX secretion system outer membrane channel protein PorV [Bacteroidota bacterium]